jgi:hypothetical protein
MQNSSDLSHISRSIQQNTADAEKARQQAASQRIIADQKYQDDDSDGAAYYEKEALRFEQQADELESKNEQLQADQQRLEARLNELQAQREQLERDYADRLNHLENEIVQVRGSGLML